MTTDKGQIQLGFGLHKHDRLPPDNGFLVIMIQNADALQILPKYFAHQEVICDHFYFYLLFVFNQSLNLPNAGQGSIEFRHNYIYCPSPRYFNLRRRGFCLQPPQPN